MSWKEIKRSINSNLNTPLNEFFDSLSNEQKALLNGISDELNNSTYGLKAIKNSLGSSGSGDSKPFYTSGLKTDIIFNNRQISTLPYEFTRGCAVVYNNKIHILGSSYSERGTKHYSSYNEGKSFSNTSTLPYNFREGCACIYNGKINILGGIVDGHFCHYEWDGSSWTSVSRLPYYFYGNDHAVVYNNEIHILGSKFVPSTNGQCHYKWDGTSWTSVSTLPDIFEYGSVVVYDNEIHMLLNNMKHYKFDGNQWILVSDSLPFGYCKSLVYNGEINTFRGNVRYKYNGFEWIKEARELPYSAEESSCILAYNNEIVMIGGNDGTGSYTNYCGLKLEVDCSISLPKGLCIDFFDLPNKYIIPQTNCSKQSNDDPITVDNDGLIKFKILDNDSAVILDMLNNYSIF